MHAVVAKVASVAIAVAAMTTEDLTNGAPPANQSQNTTMMNKWASRIIRTRKARRSDSATDTEDDEDLDAPVVDDVGIPAEIDEGEIEERILIDESPADDAPATDLSPDLEIRHHVDEDFVPTDGGYDDAVGGDDAVEEVDNSHEDDAGGQQEGAMIKENTIAVEEEGLHHHTKREQPHEDITGEEKQPSLKKRKVKKRLVGSNSTSIKQMKDAVVRTQAMIAASKISTIQTMTTYATAMQSENNPRSDTVLLHYDEIVERPDKKSEGERARVLPKWTMLLPKGANVKMMGAELEKLGKAMQEEKKRSGTNKKSKAKTVEKREFEYDVVHSCEKYLESIYGGPVTDQIGSKKAKTMRKN